MTSVSNAANEISETRLLARAVTQRWPIKPEYRETVIRRLLMIVLDESKHEDGTPRCSIRERIAAARAIISAEAQNQADEQQQEGRTIHHEHDHVIGVTATTVDVRRPRLLALAERLGIRVVDGRVIEPGADGAAAGNVGSDDGDGRQSGHSA